MKITITWPIVVLSAIVMAFMTYLLQMKIVPAESLVKWLIPALGVAILGPAGLKINGGGKVIINGNSTPPSK